MKTQEIADRLVACCRSGKFEEAQKELFASDAVSREPEESKLSPRETKGLPAIIEKGHKFTAMLEQVHSITVSDPIVTNHVFACTMDLDVTLKGQGRTTLSELCVYNVQHGKIVAEHFHM